MVGVGATVVGAAVVLGAVVSGPAVVLGASVDRGRQPRSSSALSSSSAWAVVEAASAAAAAADVVLAAALAPSSSLPPILGFTKNQPAARIARTPTTVAMIRIGERPPDPSSYSSYISTTSQILGKGPGYRNPPANR